jgi:hypothetical protein
MKRCFVFLAALGLFACATSVAPANDGVPVGGGVEAGDEGNPYSGDSGSGSETGDPLADSGQTQDAAATDTGTATDAAVDTGPVSTAGVCSKTTIQKTEYFLAVTSGGTDCTVVSACSSGQCCYQGTFGPLCVTQ